MPTVKQLKAEAKRRKIKGYSKMKKAQLVAALGEGKPILVENGKGKKPKKVKVKKPKKVKVKKPKKVKVKKPKKVKVSSLKKHITHEITRRNLYSDSELDKGIDEIITEYGLSYEEKEDFMEKYNKFIDKFYKKPVKPKKVKVKKPKKPKKVKVKKVNYKKEYRDIVESRIDVDAQEFNKESGGFRKKYKTDALEEKAIKLAMKENKLKWKKAVEISKQTGNDDLQTLFDEQNPVWYPKKGGKKKGGRLMTSWEQDRDVWNTSRGVVREETISDPKTYQSDKIPMTGAARVIYGIASGATSLYGPTTAMAIGSTAGKVSAAFGLGMREAKKFGGSLYRHDEFHRD